jgi:hypothetical protein
MGPPRVLHSSKKHDYPLNVWRTCWNLSYGFLLVWCYNGGNVHICDMKRTLQPGSTGENLHSNAIVVRHLHRFFDERGRFQTRYSN